MNIPKAEYLKRIRAQSVYPTFRTFIRIIALLFYGIGAFCIIGGVFEMFAGIFQMNTGLRSHFALLVGVSVGLFCIFIGKINQEVSLMLADIADSITDFNSRYDQQ